MLATWRETARSDMFAGKFTLPIIYSLDTALLVARAPGGSS